MICNIGGFNEYIFICWQKNLFKINYIYRLENEEFFVLIVLVYQENIIDNLNFLQVFLMKLFKFVGVFQICCIQNINLWIRSVYKIYKK